MTQQAIKREQRRARQRQQQMKGNFIWGWLGLAVLVVIGVIIWQGARPRLLQEQSQPFARTRRAIGDRMSEPALTPTLTQPRGMPRRWEVFIHALLFVLGFSLIFTIGWGGAVTVLGQLFGQYNMPWDASAALSSSCSGWRRWTSLRFPGSMLIRGLNTPVSAGLMAVQHLWAFSSPRAGVHASARPSGRS